MNDKACLALLVLLVATAAQLRGQETPGVRLHGTVAAIAGRTTGTTVRATSQGGESSPDGGAVAASFTLTSGSHIPNQVARILEHTVAVGWQLLGAPGTSDRTTGEIFVGAGGATIKTGPIQYFDADTLRYVHADDASQLLPRQGFWLFSYWGGEGQAFTAEPDIATRNWLNEVPQGNWVLYSPPGKIILGNIQGITIYAWNSDTQAYDRLVPGDALEPLKGYWVYRQTDE